MSDEVNIEIYKMKVRETGNLKEYNSFLSIEGIDFIKELFSDLSKSIKIDNDIKKKVYFEFKTPEIVNFEYGTYLFGYANKGTYGSEKEIININNLSEESRKLDKNDTVLNKFHYLIYVPYYEKIDLKFAVLVVQRIGGDGILSNFKSYLTNFLNKLIEHHILEIDPLFHQSYFDNYLKETKIKNLKIISDLYPDKETDRILGRTQEKALELEIKIKSKGFSLVDDVKTFLKNAENNNPFLHFSERFNINTEQISSKKIVFKQNGKDRTLVYQNQERFKIPIIVTDEIEFDKKGNPKYDFIQSVFKKYALDFSNFIQYLRENNEKTN
jgi:hypothetical protein